MILCQSVCDSGLLLVARQNERLNYVSIACLTQMELCGLKYVASLPHHYAGPRHELRRTVRLNPATCRGAGWIADTMLQLKDIVTEEISKHSDDMASFNAFTSRLTDPEPYVTGTSNAGGENDGTTHGGTKSLLNTIEMTVIVTLCFIDKGG